MARLVLACFKPPTDDESTSTRSVRDIQVNTSVPENRVVAYVELLRRTSEPLGLVVEGGADRDMAVHVAALRPGGVAEKSRALQVGDRILSINGTATEHLIHSEVNALLHNAGNVVNLEICFEGEDVDDCWTVKKMATITLPRERNSFGFTISGGRTENRPITVSNVTVHSTAYRNGVLKAGDRILRVNGTDVSRASQMETLSLLKASEDNCTVEVEYDVTQHEGLTETRGPLLVELLKPKRASLGITLSGSPINGVPIWISRIKEAGIADRCGALHVGDQLLSVNGVTLEHKSISEVVQLLLHSDFHVKLEIVPAHNFTERPDFSREEAMSDTMSHLSRIPSFSSRSHSGRQSQLSLASSATTTHLTSHPESMVIQLQADNIGFGLSLSGGAREYENYHLFISKIEEGGPAASLGQLLVGDRVIAINGVKMEGVTLQQAQKLVQEAGDVIDMEVEFDVEDNIVPTSGKFQVKMVKTASLNLGVTINGSHQHGDPIWIANLKKGGIAYRMGMLQPGDVLLAINEESLESANLQEAARLLKSAGNVVTLEVSRDSTNIGSHPETVIYSVELHRHGQSLGITLNGSKDRPGHPIIISNIKEGGVAYKTGTLRVGDRILAINGESLFGKTLPEALALLHSAGDVVNLKISKATRRSRARSKASNPMGRPYRYGRDFPMRRRQLPGAATHRLPRVGSYGSSSFLHGMRTRRLSATTLTTLSGRSTPDNHHAAVGLDRNDSVLSVSSSQSKQDSGVRLELAMGGGLSSRLTPTDLPGSAFRRPNSVGVPPPRLGRYSLDGYGVNAYSSGRLTRSDLWRLREMQGRPNRSSFTETDEEMSHEEEDITARFRRGSMPARSTFTGPERWDFKPRRPSYTPRRLIGRVSPLTFSDTSRPGTASPFPRLAMSSPGTTSPLETPLSENDPGNAAKASRDEHPLKKPLVILEVDSAPTLSGATGVTPTVSSQKQAENACLEECKMTLTKSVKYIEQLKTLAESGSSDPDSDSEPHSKSGELPPYVQDKLLQTIKTAMNPTRMEPHTVELQKDGASDVGFGFSVADGLIEPGVYVKQVKAGGPADKHGKLQPFDRILKVNDIVVKDYDCCKIVPLLNQVGEEVALIVARNPLAATEAGKT